MTDDIPTQIREKISALKAEIEKYEKALIAIDGGLVKIVTPNINRDFSDILPSRNKTQSYTVSDAILAILTEKGVMNRKKLLPLMEADRPGTSAQSVSSALNAMRKAGKVRLNNGKWSVK